MPWKRVLFLFGRIEFYEALDDRRLMRAVAPLTYSTQMQNAEKPPSYTKWLKDMGLDLGTSEHLLKEMGVTGTPRSQREAPSLSQRRGHLASVEPEDWTDDWDAAAMDAALEAELSRDYSEASYEPVERSTNSKAEYHEDYPKGAYGLVRGDSTEDDA